METQEKFIRYVEEVKNILAPHHLPDAGLSDIGERIRCAELIVPVVGGFSAGKSTLINSFLGHNILPTAITPETSLATELHYDETNERIEALTPTGQNQCYAVSDFSSIKDNAKKFQYLRIYLNNDNLKSNQPLVLVDMPGFNAPIESHNQAIFSYLQKGVYFVFLTSIEDGNITSSMGREIENIQQIGKGFSFCVSKTNLRPTEDVQEVRDKIAEQLLEDFGYTGEVTLLDMDGGHNLKAILNAIQPDGLFSSLFLDDLKDNYLSISQSINLKISTFTSDKKEVEETLTALQKGIEDIQAKKDEAISSVQQRYSQSSVNAIKETVTSTILKQKIRLADLAIKNQNAFERELNSLVKNATIAAAHQRFQKFSQELVEEIGGKIHTSLSHVSNNSTLGNFVLKLADKNSKSITKMAENALQAASTYLLAKVSKQSLQWLLKGTLHVVGAVLVLLPELLSFLNKEAKERERREQVEQQIVNSVVPQIQQQLDAALPDLMQQQITLLIQNISNEFESQLQRKREEIQAAQEEKSAHAEKLDSQIAYLREVQYQLTHAANHYLFT